MDIQLAGGRIGSDAPGDEDGSQGASKAHVSGEDLIPQGLVVVLPDGMGQDDGDALAVVGDVTDLLVDLQSGVHQFLFVSDIITGGEGVAVGGGGVEQDLSLGTDLT